MRSDQKRKHNNRNGKDEVAYFSTVPLPHHQDKESQFGAFKCVSGCHVSLLQFQDMENLPSQDRGSNMASRESVCEGGEVSWCAPANNGIRSI